MLRTVAAPLACASALLCAQRPAAQEPDFLKTGARARVELPRFAELLDSAASRVSRPSPFQLMGPAAAGSHYLLPGYGAIFVLPARALPGEAMIVVQKTGPGGQPVISVLRRDGRRQPRPKDGRVRAEVPGPPELRELDREIQQMESLVAAYSREADLASRDAERALEDLAKEIRERFPDAPPLPTAAPVAPAVPPAAVPPGVSAVPAAQPATPTPPQAVAQPSAPALPRAAVAPPAPPWRFWFQSEDDGDPRTADQVVSAVREALIQALEARGGLLTIVKPEDYVVVAVDFSARGFAWRPERRAERTLVVKAKKRDLDERRAGKLAAEELRKRIETLEY